jgi:hypothetical protein
MGLTRKQLFERNKSKRVRTLVIACSQLAHKNPPEEFLELMTAHIVAVLPHKLMTRLIKGDMGQPMREVMKLTVPFLVR